MKIIIYVGMVLVLFGNLACESKLEPKMKSKVKFEKEEPILEKKIRPPFHDECSGSNYTAKLDGIEGEDIYEFTISLFDKNEKLIKRESLDLPNSLSSINKCTKDYVEIRLACGGQCYSEIFVFRDDRESMQFYFSQTVHNSDHLIAHIRNESFDTIIVQSIYSSEEQHFILKDFDFGLYFEPIDNIWVHDDLISLKYKSTSGKLVEIESKLKID